MTQLYVHENFHAPFKFLPPQSLGINNDQSLSVHTCTIETIRFDLKLSHHLHVRYIWPALIFFVIPLTPAARLQQF